MAAFKKIVSIDRNQKRKKKMAGIEIGKKKKDFKEIVKNYFEIFHDLSLKSKEIRISFPITSSIFFFDIFLFFFVFRTRAKAKLSFRFCLLLFQKCLLPDIPLKLIFSLHFFSKN